MSSQNVKKANGITMENEKITGVVDNLNNERLATFREKPMENEKCKNCGHEGSMHSDGEYMCAGTCVTEIGLDDKGPVFCDCEKYEKMEKPFNLSEILKKINLKTASGRNRLPSIVLVEVEEKIKEFIRRLKEEFLFVRESVERIDKLAGDDLVK